MYQVIHGAARRARTTTIEVVHAPGQRPLTLLAHQPVPHVHCYRRAAATTIESRLAAAPTAQGQEREGPAVAVAGVGSCSCIALGRHPMGTYRRQWIWIRRGEQGSGMAGGHQACRRRWRRRPSWAAVLTTWDSEQRAGARVPHVAVSVSTSRACYCTDDGWDANLTTRPWPQAVYVSHVADCV
jgi:hypothetical protein